MASTTNPSAPNPATPPASYGAEDIPLPKAVPDKDYTADLKTALLSIYCLPGISEASHIFGAMARIFRLYDSVRSNALAMATAAEGLTHDERSVPQEEAY